MQQKRPFLANFWVRTIQISSPKKFSRTSRMQYRCKACSNRSGLSIALPTEWFRHVYVNILTILETVSATPPPKKNPQLLKLPKGQLSFVFQNWSWKMIFPIFEKKSHHLNDGRQMVWMAWLNTDGVVLYSHLLDFVFFLIFVKIKTLVHMRSRMGIWWTTLRGVF